MQYPRARHDLEFVPITHEGRSMILVRDRLGLVPYGTGVPAGLLPILALMDGQRSLADLEREITALQDGRPVTVEDIERVLAELDAGGLLDTPRYQAKKAEAAAAFAARDIREPLFAGPAYPDNPELLVPYLDAILADAPEFSLGDGRILAAIAPHIDPEAGRAGYAAAYAPLRGLSPKRVVVLGVGHQILRGLYCLTDKAYGTPLGNIPADAAAVAGLRRAGGACVDPGDLQHRDEHSVEFQAVFLRHVLVGDFSLVPVLCGSPRSVLSAQSRSAFLDYAGPFLDALRGMAADPDTLFVAGVDFSHIGPKFGHDKPALELEQEAMAHDAALLAALAAGDPEAFWAESARVDDGYNVCGLASLATLAEVVSSCALTVTCHDIMRESETASAVTFAAAALTAR
ncbi:AmmeMemoRadiSam system protein B [Solidesulfovibrio sp. C21]|uniref:AmmeMemoRadiSam system protein B n=1 Tax=Solidesulfovibrio sp. C21 TaxID=3398613 RepID=UPI0039FDD5F6